MEISERIKSVLKRQRMFNRTDGERMAEMLSGSYGVTLGALAGTGLTVVENGHDCFRQTLFTFTDRTLTVTDALAYASTKIYDFPAGRIHVLGTMARLKFGVTTVRADTINDNAAMDWSLGSVAASNVTLATTMVDLAPKADHTLDGVADAYTGFVNSVLAAAAVFDGTTTALDAYLNVSFPTATDIDADGTLKVSGTIALTWINLGDV